MKKSESPFKLTALDIHRMFQIAIYIYITAIIPLLIYLFGVFLRDNYTPNLFVVITLNTVAGLIAFLQLLRIFSAWTMKESVKQVLHNKLTKEDLFTYKVARNRILSVICYASVTLAIYAFILENVTLTVFTTIEKIMVWGVLLSWIFLAFLY